MSLEHLRLFFKAAIRDFQLQKQFQQLSDVTDEEFIQQMIKFGRKRGYHFNKDELKKFAVESVTTLIFNLLDQEISDREKKMVSTNLFENIEEIGRNKTHKYESWVETYCNSQRV